MSGHENAAQTEDEIIWLHRHRPGNYSVKQLRKRRQQLASSVTGSLLDLLLKQFDPVTSDSMCFFSILSIVAACFLGNAIQENPAAQACQCNFHHIGENWSQSEKLLCQWSPAPRGTSGTAEASVEQLKCFLCGEWDDQERRWWQGQRFAWPVPVCSSGLWWRFDTHSGWGLLPSGQILVSVEHHLVRYCCWGRGALVNL